MKKEDLDNVVELIKRGKYEMALEKMVDVQPLKDCDYLSGIKYFDKI